MKPKVYIESSVISYYSSRTSINLLNQAKQFMTQEWWEKGSARYDWFISELVFEEIAVGDQFAAARRLKLVEGIPILKGSEAAARLALKLIEEGPLPKKADADAAHIAIAAVIGMDYIASWNCKHIANPYTVKIITKILGSHGLACPGIYTPEQLLGGFDD